jgi:hypothetical protein
MRNETPMKVKVIWLSRMFYGVSQSMNGMNPFDDLSLFLESKISALKWGGDRREAKERFSRKYHLLLDLYGIKLGVKNILIVLDREDQTALQVVEQWAEHSEFPANW